MKLNELAEYASTDFAGNPVNFEIDDFVVKLKVRDYLNNIVLSDSQEKIDFNSIKTTFWAQSLVDYAVAKGFDEDTIQTFFQEAYHSCIVNERLDDFRFLKSVSQAETNWGTDYVKSVVALYESVENKSKLAELTNILSSTPQELLSTLTEFPGKYGEVATYEDLFTEVIAEFYIMDLDPLK